LAKLSCLFARAAAVPLAAWRKLPKRRKGWSSLHAPSELHRLLPVPRPAVLLWHARRWFVQRPFIVKGRQRRYADFVVLCGVLPEHRIVDVGSGQSDTLARFNNQNRIVALDLFAQDKQIAPNVTFVQGDATAMPFADGEFDIAFCNSVIEHLAPPAQRALASEIRRVARGYWVQTPNRYFPIEPHQLIPCYQFLPRRIRRSIDYRLTAGYTEMMVSRDLLSLFPDAELYEERVGGLVKSFAVYRPSNRSDWQDRNQSRSEFRQSFAEPSQLPTNDS
jgi:SAM-dependent methyltransferase